MCGLGTRPSMHQGDAWSGNNASYNESRREATQTHTMYCLVVWSSTPTHDIHMLVWHCTPITSWFDTHMLIWSCTLTRYSPLGWVLCAWLSSSLERMMTSTYTGIAHMMLAWGWHLQAVSAHIVFTCWLVLYTWPSHAGWHDTHMLWACLTSHNVHMCDPCLCPPTHTPTHPHTWNHNC